MRICDACENCPSAKKELSDGSKEERRTSLKLQYGDDVSNKIGRVGWTDGRKKQGKKAGGP